MTISLSQQSAQCLVYPSNRKAPKQLARELIEQEVGLTSDKFWSALTKLTIKTQWKPLVSRATYSCQARLAYQRPTLWILEGITSRQDGRQAFWTLEIHKPSQQCEDTFIWVFGLEGINGAL